MKCACLCGLKFAAWSSAEYGPHKHGADAEDFLRGIPAPLETTIGPPAIFHLGPRANCTHIGGSESEHSQHWKRRSPMFFKR